MADNDYYHRLSEMNPGELADGLALEGEFDAISRGFDKLPVPHRDGQGFEGPVRVGDAINPDEAVNKQQLDEALGTAKSLAVASYGDFNAAAWATLPSGTYLLFGTGSQITNSPFTLVAAKTYYFAVHHAIGANLYCDSVLMASSDDAAHIDLGREAWRSGPTLAAAGWKAAVVKSGDTVTGDMLGITAPKFANDKKFATTEFVQRAINLESVGLVHLAGDNMAGPLAGKIGAATTNNTNNAGFIFDSDTGLFSAGDGNWQLASNGIVLLEGFDVLRAHKQIRTPKGAPNNNDLSINAGFTFGDDGDTGLFAEGGTANAGSVLTLRSDNNLVGRFQVGPLSTGINGYEVSHTGRILQWGEFTANDNGLPAQFNVTFPLAFPSGCMQAFLNIGNNIGGGAVVTSVEGLSKTAITGFTMGPSGQRKYRWMAIGY